MASGATKSSTQREVTGRHPVPTDGETLKVKKLSAEDLSVHADLFAHEGGFTPRPAWQVIEAARRQMLTGELSLATTPTTHVYLRDGQVYFAERTTDGGLGVRLLVEGVITRQQMGKGALLVSGVEHLGRMFQRDPSIDRQPVELCVELMTDDVLTSVANDVIDHYTMTMYKRHANGIDRWLPTRIEVITHIVEGSYLAEPDATITPGPGPRRAAPVAEPVAVEPLVEAPVVQPVVETPVVEDVVVEDEAVAVLVEDVVVEDVVVEDVVVEDVVVEDVVVEDVTPEVVTQPEPSDDIALALALAATFSESADGSDNGSGISLAQSAVDAIMSSAIADEVAEAVRRALAAIDAAAQPVTNISPTDFTGSAPTLEQPATTSAA